MEEGRTGRKEGKKGGIDGMIKGKEEDKVDRSDFNS